MRGWLSTSNSEDLNVVAKIMTNTKALAHIVPDKTYPGMWRVVRPDNSLSDMVNKTRAKDVARGLAENAVYLGNAA